MKKQSASTTRKNRPIILAKAKAEAIIPRIKGDAVLITSDQVVACTGKILEKPENEKEFHEFVHLYNKGYSAETVTAVVVTDIKTGKQESGIDIAKIWMRPIPKKTINKLI